MYAEFAVARGRGRSSNLALDRQHIAPGYATFIGAPHGEG